MLRYSVELNILRIFATLVVVNSEDESRLASHFDLFLANGETESAAAGIGYPIRLLAYFSL